MKYQLQVLIICLMVIGLSAERWSEPIKLEETTNSSFGLGLFSPNVNKSYIIYSRPESESMTQEFGVRTYNNFNHSLSYFTKLSTDRLYFTADIQGSADGEQLLVALGSSRDKVLEAPINDSSFFNIFLTYSLDAGANWTNESAIDAESNETQVARIDPQLVGIDELGQMYLFYMNIYPNNDKSLAVVKYDPEKKNLIADETIIVSENNPLFAYSATYSYVNDTLVLHVVFAGNDSKLMYVTSEGGKNWTEPIAVANISLDSHTVSLAANSKVAPSKLFLTYIDNNNATYVRVSEDLGKTWSKSHKLSKEGASTLSVSVCGDEEEQAAFVLYSSKNKLKLKMVEIEKDGDIDIDSLKTPFKKMKIAGAMITCNKKGRRYKLTALGTDSNATVAYLSTMNLKD